ncbi:hypothetical protein [Paenibacillus qinlingensis]|uniref:Glycosyl hydrolase family 88 n=1 Tax=Paenibacillus qinlingensis TaxID=1837343 RepID=A0ABU1NTX5_9BACL|nr:hypothetical protein [Paenibacillus qinlingensis]MDR6550789.1 hypothetical protein [Paenibacillus qinlingensis]
MNVNILDIVQSHINMLIEHGKDTYGDVHTPMFMATLDPMTKKYPVDDSRSDDFMQRAYRLIHAPKGCSAYWDHSTLNAMVHLANQTGESRYLEEADQYLDYFMKHCVSEQGLFLWGNHHFYDAFRDRNVWFYYGPPLMDFDSTQQPTFHEMRPYVPDWEHMYRLNPTAVETHIRMCEKHHVYDPLTGGFDRHSSQQKDYAFIEAGGILVQSLGFLFSKTKDTALLEKARKIAVFSYSHRNTTTNLIVNCPTQQRWDSKVTTTEVGIWARTLLRTVEYIQSVTNEGDGRAGEIALELKTMALSALQAYLIYGYDSKQESYYGRVNLDGTPDLGQQETVYMPDSYSDVWAFLFPSHDYPMSMAMTILEHIDHSELFALSAKRWADVTVRDCMSMPHGQVRYAEHYGRNIVFLAEYARISGRPEYRIAAERLAEEAVKSLYQQEMFVGHTGAKWYDAVDGVGFLMAGLLYLHNGNKDVIRSLF